MAIGDNGNSNNNQLKDITYYSRLKFRSADNKRSVSISFWGGLMVFEINDVDVNNGYKSSALETIRLSLNKAKILSYELKTFKDYLKAGKIDPNKAFGVSSGLGNEIPYIAFSANNDEENTIGLTIGKINSSGSIISSQTFMFDNTSYLYGLEWTNLSKMEVEKVSYEHVELDTIIDAIEDFAKHMNGSLAYSYYDLGRYEINKTNKKFDSIFDKLGIERISSGNNRYNGGSNSFLNNLAAKSSNSISMDNLEGLLDD